MLYHERERKNKENINFVYIVYLLTKLCNIFDEAFFIDVSIKEQLYYPSSENKGTGQLCSYCTADLHLGFRICKNQVFS